MLLLATVQTMSLKEIMKSIVEKPHLLEVTKMMIKSVKTELQTSQNAQSVQRASNILKAQKLVSQKNKHLSGKMMGKQNKIVTDKTELIYPEMQRLK